MKDAAIPSREDHDAPGDETAEGLRESGGHSDGIESSNRVVQSDFVTIVAEPRLGDGEPRRRARIHPIPGVDIPPPGARHTVGWKLSEKAGIDDLIPTQPSPKDLLVAVSRQPRVYGEQKPTAERKEEQGTQGSQPRRRARADGRPEAGRG
jgi:hypothetical protein